jgi:hypothetical protein
MAKIVDVQKAVSALQHAHFVASGNLQAATVRALQEVLGEPEASGPMMADVQEIMHLYYRKSTKIENAANTLMRAITEE